MSELQKNQKHKSVLVNEVLTYLQPLPGKVYIDVTFGAGGHSKALLSREPRCTVIGIDWDDTVLKQHAEELKQEFPERFSYVWGNFGSLALLCKKHKIGPVAGILADFGTSQMQITGKEGFSVYRDTPLDMRMSKAHHRVTADQLINTADERTLKDIFFRLGEERHSAKIVRAILEQRVIKPIKTTLQLAHLIEQVVPRKPGRKIHPATQVFQALRMHVNGELDHIHSFLLAAPQLLIPGGRLVCISFHSLEDRIVKESFRDADRAKSMILLTKKVVVASEKERAENPSSRSAKLRAAQKI